MRKRLRIDKAKAISGSKGFPLIRQDKLSAKPLRRLKSCVEVKDLINN